jgi:anti-sigma B factor antagonist
MDISIRQLQRVDVISLSGRLDASSSPELKREIDALLDKGRARLVLDLTNLETLSSAGLRVIADARKRARAFKLTDLEGGDVRIAGPSKYIREVLDLTGFSTMLQIYDDTLSAVGSF